MKRTFFTLIVLSFITFSFGQEIKLVNNFFSYNFEQNDKKLSWKQLLEEAASNLEANVWIKKAKTQKTISSILAFTGGGLAGISIGQALTGKKPNWTWAYVGGGMGVIGIVLEVKFSKNARKGIELYNSSLTSSAHSFEPEFEIIANGNGIGLAIKF